MAMLRIHRNHHHELTQNSDGYDRDSDMATKLGDLLCYFGHRRNYREAHRST